MFRMFETPLCGSSSGILISVTTCSLISLSDKNVKLHVLSNVKIHEDNTNKGVSKFQNKYQSFLICPPHRFSNTKKVENWQPNKDVKETYEEEIVHHTVQYGH